LKARTDFEEAVAEIKTKIEDYLREKEVIPLEKKHEHVRCFHPNHKNDSNPSLRWANPDKYGWRIKCFGCGWSGDIFDAYALLEGTPAHGPGWFTQTLVPLATKYNVMLPEREVSEEEKYLQDLYRTYETAASLINHKVNKMSSDIVKGYIEEKQWTEDTLRSLDIGTLSYSRLSSCIDGETLERYGLKRPDIFAKDALIFTMRDRYGYPIRFYARLPNNKPKFTSTSTRQLLFDPWKNRGHLYLSHLLTKDSSEVILVEGQTDAVSLWQAGYSNVVAPCGSKQFSEKHSDTLILSGIIKGTILFDGDEEGQNGVLNILSQSFIKSGSLSLSVVRLPDQYDPDLYLRTEGKDQLDFLLQQKLSAFEYLLSRENPGGQPDQICMKLVPYIAGTTNEILREEMARTLSVFVGQKISTSAILAEAKRIDERVLSAHLEKQKGIVKVTNRLALEDITGARSAYRDAIEKMEALDQEQGGDASIRRKCLIRLTSWYQSDSGKAIGGYSLGDEFSNLQDLLVGGSWKSGTLIVIGAIQNMGKSSFLDSLIWSIISREDNNSIGYILTIDDPAEARFRRMAAGSLRNKNFTQNMMSNPHIFLENYNYEEVFELRHQAYQNLLNVVNKGKLFIEDSLSGRTVAYLETRVQQLRRENPTANLVIGLDNLHDAQDWPTLDKIERGSRITKDLKKIAEVYRATVICTAEYRKGDPSTKGGDEDLADTRALKFAPRLTLHLFSDVVAKGEDHAIGVRREDFSWGNYSVTKLIPVVEVAVGKNKISVERGTLFYDFYPASSFFVPISKESANDRFQARKEELQGSYPGNKENDNYG